MAKLTTEEYQAITTLTRFSIKKITERLNAVADIISDQVEQGVITYKTEYLNDAVIDEIMAAIDSATTSLRYRDLDPDTRQMLFDAHKALGFPELEEDYANGRDI